MEELAPDKAEADDADRRAKRYPERSEDAAFITRANIAPGHIENKARHFGGSNNIGKSGRHDLICEKSE